ncbi:hypothetical protein ERX37_00915 [Macrococcus hajekii]|uniref:Phage protein n=1 Tax=Macrococcus hajekii TaxID=198482 RepID=A0A4R6BLT6_9STAP|nr:hypothetical protein [Macrococcus hajekii]TDM02681.1 hypothetical protein ERX37_00915 [Macrococcus hajekii]GGB03014.1 hypothetical protein GCM10007190_08760 [Macrococcus hajekii]
MPAILLKASLPTLLSKDTQFQLLQNESEKEVFINRYRKHSKEAAKQYNRPHICKLEFIYPDEYTETIVMKAE